MKEFSGYQQEVPMTILDWLHLAKKAISVNETARAVLYINEAMELIKLGQESEKSGQLKPISQDEVLDILRNPAYGSNIEAAQAIVEYVNGR